MSESEISEATHEIPVLSDSRILVFGLGDARFGVDLLAVREIIEPRPCKAVPESLPHRLGIINLRGQVIEVIDLRRRLGYEPSSSEPAGTAFMVVDSDGDAVACVVDRVEAVIELQDSDIQRDGSIGSRVPGDAMTGIAKTEDGVIFLIDLNRLLSS